MKCFPKDDFYPGLELEIAGYAGVDRRLWHELDLVVVDFETTGVDVENDRIVEVGLVRFRGGLVTSKFDTLINPGRSIDPDSTRIHGIDDAMVAESPRFASVARSVVEFMGDATPVAYNHRFDRAFLHREMAMADVDIDVVDWIDPYVWSLYALPDLRSKKLTSVAERLGVALGDAHRAWADAEATGHVLYAMRDHLPTTIGELLRIQAIFETKFKPRWFRK